MTKTHCCPNQVGFHLHSQQPLSTDQTGQDFTAILIGDVSGNWGAGGVGSHLKSGSSAELALQSTKTLTESQVTVGLMLSMEQGSLYGADIVLGYDTAVVSALSVAKTSLAQNFSMATNLNQAGQVRIAMAGATPIISGGLLLTATFDVVGQPGTISPLRIVSASFNEGAITTTLSSGILTIVPLGDANSDLEVNALDITKVERIIASLDAHEPGADANRDGSINALDITGTERIIAGLD